MIITGEMEEARARLEAWRDSFETYPAYPEEEPPSPSPQVVRLVLHGDAGLQIQNLQRRQRQTEGELGLIRSNLNSHLAYRKGKQDKDKPF